MPLQEKNYWLDTVTVPTSAADAPLPESVEAAVIGGGFTGLSAARTLATRGARVAVLEAETMGWGASSRNGGMVLTGLKLSPEAVIEKFGLDIARRMFNAALASIDCVERVVTDEAIECNFARSGHLEVAYKPAHFAYFQQSAELMAKEFNHSVRLVPKAELRAEIGSQVYHGGLVDEASAGLNPAQYAAGLARAAAAAGAVLCAHARVTNIARETAGFRVTTARGSLRAEKIFVGTSGHTGPATPRLQRKIIPIGSYIIATEPLPPALAANISPRNRMIFDSKNFLYYFRLTPDNRMLFGGRAAFLPETPSTVRESAPILRAGMVQVYPQLRDVPVAYVWGGTLDFPFDMLPHAGQLDGAYFALGYAGHGVAMATHLGELMARTMLGENVDNPFAEIPFPGAPLGLYNGRPWFLPLAGAWHKWLDWVS